MAAGLTLLAGLPIALVGVKGHTFYPALAEPRLLLPHLAQEVLPDSLGVFVLIGIVGASMSTANGTLLVTSIVTFRNVVEHQFLRRSLAKDKFLSLMRILILPLAMGGVLLAWRHPEPGVLLILAFDER